MDRKVDNSEKAVKKFFKTIIRNSCRCAIVWNQKMKGKDKIWYRSIKRSTKNLQKQEILKELSLFKKTTI